MFCKHEWEKVTERREKNELSRNVQNIKATNLGPLLDTYILVLKCIKCGKLDKTVEKV